MFKDNLKYLRRKHNMYQSDLANALGFTSSATISEWESGKYYPNFEMVVALSRVFQVSIDDLMESDLTTEQPKHIDVLQVPILARVSAGEPIISEENIIGYTPVPKYKYRNRKMYALEVNGDSMDRVFKDGQIILVDSEGVVENGEYAVVKVNGDEALVKQIKYEKGKVILIPKSNNPDYLPNVYTEDDDIKIIGKVVGSFNEF